MTAREARGRQGAGTSQPPGGWVSWAGPGRLEGDSEWGTSKPAFPTLGAPWGPQPRCPSWPILGTLLLLQARELRRALAPLYQGPSACCPGMHLKGGPGRGRVMLWEVGDRRGRVKPWEVVGVWGCTGLEGRAVDWLGAWAEPAAG